MHIPFCAVNQTSHNNIAMQIIVLMKLGNGKKVFHHHTVINIHRLEETR